MTQRVISEQSRRTREKPRGECARCGARRVLYTGGVCSQCGGASMLDRVEAEGMKANAEFRRLWDRR